MKMVFVDDQGTRVHAIVENEFVPDYAKGLKEGESVIIDTFKSDFFNLIAKELLSAGAFELAESIAQEREGVFPKAITGLVGQRLLLKVNISADNLKSEYAPYKVEKYWTKHGIIEKFKSTNSSQSSEVIDVDDDGRDVFGV
ncbi:hypothetical protein AALP_AAs65394U000300 [Arabis alpina]|uniref:Replication protein A 70 kDa DNA-binding subunit B/D first OB fold domain-containing protein n=1 Tax=Arabis alpina TaxID=50452 RepID=A0A087G0V5_ARAAL|nr:hypothetical protein AALP_AAs65394U000300 [Arabis alpina]